MFNFICAFTTSALKYKFFDSRRHLFLYCPLFYKLLKTLQQKYRDCLFVSLIAMTKWTGMTNLMLDCHTVLM